MSDMKILATTATSHHFFLLPFLEELTDKQQNWKWHFRVPLQHFGPQRNRSLWRPTMQEPRKKDELLAWYNAQVQKSLEV